MAIQQHGIARGQARPRRVAVSGRAEPASLATDVRTLAEAVEMLSTHLEQTESRLVRRLNEMLLSGTLAQRPAAGTADRIYVAVDQAPGSRLAFDNGSAWIAP